MIDDRRLDREARFGEASDLRFTAGPSELRGCLEHAFGRDAVIVYAHLDLHEDEARDWCERAIGAWIAGAARSAAKSKKRKENNGGKWATRIEKAKTKHVSHESLSQTAEKTQNNQADSG